jgi:hypothetical protein
MDERRVWIFFYGAFMDPAVLQANDINVTVVVAALVRGRRLELRPRANLLADDQAVSFGSLAQLTHREIDSLYRMLDEKFGLRYLPEAVMAETLEGTLRPALCFVASELDGSMPTHEYIQQMLAAIKAVGLPEWYASYVQSLEGD